MEAERQEMTMVPEELIRVVQLPELTEQLQSIRGQWEAVVAECVAMDCTGDTLKAVKEKRAAVNRVFEALEARRKAVKKAVMAPYDALEAVYKTCVTEPHDMAEAALKEKIAEVEGGIRTDCEARMRGFFTEMCQKERVTLLTWEMGSFKISLTDARAKVPTKLQGQIADFVVRVSQEVRTIAAMEDAAEILAEYKQTLRLDQAIRTVQDRKARIEAERQAAAQEAALRQGQENAMAASAPSSAPSPDTEESGDHSPLFVRITLWPDTREQWEAVRSALTELERALDQAGVRHEGLDGLTEQVPAPVPPLVPDQEEEGREPYPWE